MDILRAGEMLAEADNARCNVHFVGTVGSAATASHMARDLEKATLAQAHDGIAKRLRALARSSKMHLLTAG